MKKILIEFGVTLKEVTLFKMYSQESCGKFQVRIHFSGAVPA
jgi:hypothetical protein